MTKKRLIRRQSKVNEPVRKSRCFSVYVSPDEEKIEGERRAGQIEALLERIQKKVSSENLAGEKVEHGITDDKSAILTTDKAKATEELATAQNRRRQADKRFDSAEVICRAVCTDRRLTLGQVKKITGLTRRQIMHWQTVNAIYLGPKEDYKWRRFSIGDVIKLMIIKEIKQNTGIPPKRLAEFISWIQKYNIVDARLPDFSVGRDIFLYSDLKSIWYSGHGVDGRVPQKWGDKPIVLMPLNDIFKKVLLNPAVFSDKFRVEKQGEQFVYFINGEKFDFASYKNHPNPGGLKLTLQKDDLPIVFNYRVKKYALHSTDGGGLVLKNAESK